MKLESLHDVLVHELRDLYSAETQISKALPKMAKAAAAPELKHAFEEHLEQTMNQIARLDRIFEKLELSSRGPKCKAIEGMIEEGKHLIASKAEPAVLDAALIAAAQRVEHYEIAAYGCARTYAQMLSDDEISQLLQESLDEEGETDKRLTEIAESAVNEEAAAAK